MLRKGSWGRSSNNLLKVTRIWISGLPVAVACELSCYFVMAAFELPVPSFRILFLLGLTNTWPAAALRNGIAPLGGFLQRALQLQEPEGQQQQPKKETEHRHYIFRVFSNCLVLKHVKFLTLWQLTNCLPESYLCYLSMFPVSVSNVQYHL